MGLRCAQADRAAAAAALEAQVAQLTLDLASKEEALKDVQNQHSTGAATEAAAPSNGASSVKEVESELAAARENLRAAEEAARQRAEELARWATAADRAAADQVCSVPAPCTLVITDAAKQMPVNKHDEACGGLSAGLPWAIVLLYRQPLSSSVLSAVTGSAYILAGTGLCKHFVAVDDYFLPDQLGS